MKNWKVIVIIFTLSGFLLACKGSKCDCPSFKPKSEVSTEDATLFASSAIPTPFY